MSFLVGFPISRHLVTREMLSGIIAPGCGVFHGVVVELKVDRLEHGLKPEHDV